MTDKVSITYDDLEVLDLGCGIGKNSILMAEIGYITLYEVGEWQ
ncbi:hypothetical protein SAMN03159341_1368 [Paenibacillus sp. 1_12]|nr:class I SAM-dependent methyltransferase [Paenibacillus sp. 1_12]SFM46891.1 hypothetical protein SAMN03159341_1368 [Paenibacillus sp. 1_12]